MAKTVNCTKEVNSTCLYGTAYSYKMCRYLIETGKSRECPFEACDKYIHCSPLDAEEVKNVKSARLKAVIDKYMR